MFARGICFVRGVVRCSSARYVATNAQEAAAQAPLSRLLALRKQLAEEESKALAEFVDVEQKESCESEVAENAGSKFTPKPHWLRIDAPSGVKLATFTKLQQSVKKLNLATVCEEAKCPVRPSRSS